MNINEIILSLNKYRKEEFDTQYLRDTIDYFKNLKNNIEEITDDEKLLTGIRLNLLYNETKYFVYFSNNKPHNVLCYRKIKLSQTAANNLQNQLYGMNNNTMIICEKIISKYTTFYFYINDTEIETEKNNRIIHNYYELINIYLGILSLYFLEHQNLNNYCSELILKNSNEFFKELLNMKNIIKDFTWQEKDRCLIFSGSIYHFLGTLYTQDLDIIYVSNNDKTYMKYMNLLKNYDCHFILEDKVIKTNNESLPYLNKWLKYDLPQLGNIDNIYTLLINPKHYFHFLGFKCYDILANIKRTLSRSNTFSLIDLILLKKLNNIDFLKDFCFKNINIRQGNAMIANDNLEPMYKKTIKYMKEWYNIDLELNFLKKHFQKCDKIYKTIYYGKIPEYNKYNNPILKYNRYIVTKYLNIYGKNSKNILDIGIGKGSAIQDYINVGIKNIYGIEPSIYSINKSSEVINKFNKSNIYITQGFGDILWTDKTIINKKYNIVILTFTIHYMIKNIDILIKNINKVTEIGSYVFIFCLDGEKIFNLLNNTNKYEIMFNKEPYWGVYQYNDIVPNKFNSDFKMLFYMKDVYGVNNGSEEYLVNTNRLINKFKNYKLILKKNFLDDLDMSLENKYNIMYDFQKQILNTHQTIILQKTN